MVHPVGAANGQFDGHAALEGALEGAADVLRELGLKGGPADVPEVEAEPEWPGHGGVGCAEQHRTFGQGQGLG